MIIIYKTLFFFLLFLALAHQVVEVRAASPSSLLENNSNFHYLAHTSLAYQLADQVVEIRVASLNSPLESNSNFHYLADLPPGQPITFNELDYLIERIADFMIVASVLLAIIYIIWGGITYMAAGANTTKVTEAQTRIKNGIIGAAVVLGVGVIISTIAGIVSRDFFCQVRIPIIGICIIP